MRSSPGWYITGFQPARLASLRAGRRGHRSRAAAGAWAVVIFHALQHGGKFRLLVGGEKGQDLGVRGIAGGFDPGHFIGPGERGVLDGGEVCGVERIEDRLDLRLLVGGQRARLAPQRRRDGSRERFIGCVFFLKQPAGDGGLLELMTARGPKRLQGRRGVCYNGRNVD